MSYLLVGSNLILILNLFINNQNKEFNELLASYIYLFYNTFDQFLINQNVKKNYQFVALIKFDCMDGLKYSHFKYEILTQSAALHVQVWWSEGTILGDLY